MIPLTGAPSPPLGSGLSSSSAIICASMIAILVAHGKIGSGPTSLSIPKAEVAAFAAKAEAGVGVICGGMDQVWRAEIGEI